MKPPFEPVAPDHTDHWDTWVLSAFAGGLGLVPLFLVCQAVDGGTGTLTTVAFGFLSGVVIGGLLGVIQLLLSRVPLRVASLVWMAAGVLGGLLAATDVGAFAKLHSEHSHMARVAVGGGLVGGALFGALLSTLEHTTTPATVRRTLVTSTLAYVVAAALTVIEPTLWVLRGYPAARTTVILVAWFLAAAALRNFVGLLFGPTRRRTLHLVLALLSIACLARAVTLRPDDISSLLAASQTRRVVIAVRSATDFDGDGASSWLGGGDCAPWNPHVGPFAAEIPGNGVDDNCRYGDAPLPRGASIEPDLAPPTEPSPVNVVFITVDALRPDHTTPYGFPRQTTPNLELFARSATRFEHAYTSGGWTALAIPSALFGVYPRTMSWRVVALTTSGALIPFPWVGAIPSDDAFLISRTIPADEPHRALPRWLARRGMRTSAVLPNKLLGFPQVFAPDFESLHVAPVDRDDSVADVAIRELGSEDPRPFFMWVHFFEPHEPMGDDPGAPDFGNTFEDRYDRDIAYCDIQLGRFLRAIDALPSHRPTAVIVASDHGEVLSDRVQAHGLDLSLDAIRIVLIARGPGLSNGVVRAPASLVDVAPTVLAWTETPAPRDLDGRDLRALPANRTVLTDLWRHSYSGEKFIDESVALNEVERLTYDVLLGAKTWARADDRGRPPAALGTAIPEPLDATLGAYLERGRPIP